ncbi:MAG TPA: histidine triad nucleotide-binding protein [Pyrinomonadaceae bacterium]|nr:histidine triad nucleotide-binding protein [Pyrinomonadaceae bacterium]
MTDQDCIFCRVVAGDVRADIVFQEDRCLAFRDINPQAPVHVLIIPREHIESLDDAGRGDEAVLGHILRIAARIANDQGLAESGFRTVINTGAGVGQSVMHLHLHVLGGRTMTWPPG